MSVYLDLINGRNPEYSIATEGLKEVGAGIKKAFSNFVGKIIEWIDKVCQWFKNHKPESKKDLRKKNDELSKENAKLKADAINEKGFRNATIDENKELYDDLKENHEKLRDVQKKKFNLQQDLSKERTAHTNDNENTAQGSMYAKAIMDILSLSIRASSAYNTLINIFIQNTTDRASFEHIDTPSNMKTFKGNLEIIEDCLDKMNDKCDFSNDRFSFNPRMSDTLIKGIISQLENEKKILVTLKKRYDNEIAPQYENGRDFIDRGIQKIFNQATGCIQTILAYLVKTINWSKKAIE